METISHKLRGLIERSGEWARNMSELMGTLDTSMDLTFSLDWKPREARSETELNTPELVRLLNKERKLLTDDDRLRVTEHFRGNLFLQLLRFRRGGASAVGIVHFTSPSIIIPLLLPFCKISEQV